jgi:hypothetical protein
MYIFEAFPYLHVCVHFLPFSAFAILNQHRQNLLHKCSAFDETLKYVNELSERMIVSEIVPRAEIIFQVFKNKMDVVCRQRLGLDIKTGRAIEEVESKGKVSSFPHWADAHESLGLQMMEDEEIYDLVSLMETE